MAVIDKATEAKSLEIRGRLGLPNEFGEIWCGWSLFGDHAPYAGYYQSRPRVGGRIFVRMRHYITSNPQTSEQQAWRGVFADAVTAWQALTSEQKLAWNRKKWPRHMTGFNRFVREYLKTH